MKRRKFVKIGARIFIFGGMAAAIRWLMVNKKISAECNDSPSCKDCRKLPSCQLRKAENYQGEVQNGK